MSTKNKMLKVIFNAHMGYGHDGLTKLAKSHGADPGKLEIGEFLLFINKKRSALKLYAANNTLAHYKNPGNKVMDMRVIPLIPCYFSGKEIHYSKALEKVIRDEFGVKEDNG